MVKPGGPFEAFVPLETICTRRLLEMQGSAGGDEGKLLCVLQFVSYSDRVERLSLHPTSCDLLCLRNVIAVTKLNYLHTEA